jgi:hypothetical protein
LPTRHLIPEHDDHQTYKHRRTRDERFETDDPAGIRGELIAVRRSTAQANAKRWPHHWWKLHG